jgi:hypothetical protein
LLDVLPHFAWQSPFAEPELIGLLQVHPKLSGGVEKGGEAHGCIAVIRFGGTSRALASLLALIGGSEGLRNSSNRISPG